MSGMKRRAFLTGTAGTLASLAGVSWATAHRCLAGEDPAPDANPAAGERSEKATLVQVPTYKSVTDNLVNARRAFEIAANDRARWLLFPEMFLSGYHADFEQEQVAAGIAEIASLCHKHRIAALVGTGWKDGQHIQNQVRILDRGGQLAGVYAKQCLCYGEDRWTIPGTTQLVFTVEELTFGVLVCNDLWVTPGFSDGPNPHLSLQAARQGAQVIFHHVNSGSDQRYRSYHESNHLTRAAEARCPIVAINAFTPPEVNATSGIVGTAFKHLETLPPDREVIRTVTFAVIENCRNPGPGPSRAERGGL